MMAPKRTTQHGFTLLEMVVTIGIFALMYVWVASFLGSVLDGRDTLNKGAQELENSQRAMTYLTLDFEQIIARPVRDVFGDVQPAVVGDQDRVSFTRLGWSNPFQLRHRSEMQRVEYWLEDEVLYRGYWPVLDQAAGTELNQDILLEGVSDFSVRFLDQPAQGDWQWLEFWPAPQVAGLPAWQQRLPRSIEVTIELTSGDTLHRFFRTVVNPWE